MRSSEHLNSTNATEANRNIFNYKVLTTYATEEQKNFDVKIHQIATHKRTREKFFPFKKAT